MLHWYSFALVRYFTGTVLHWYNFALVRFCTGTVFHWYGFALVQFCTGINVALVWFCTGTVLHWQTFLKDASPWNFLLSLILFANFHFNGAKQPLKQDIFNFWISLINLWLLSFKHRCIKSTDIKSWKLTEVNRELGSGVIYTSNILYLLFLWYLICFFLSIFCPSYICYFLFSRSDLLTFAQQTPASLCLETYIRKPNCINSKYLLLIFMMKDVTGSFYILYQEQFLYPLSGANI